MELWNFNQEDLTKKQESKETINRSGAYVMTIKEAYIQKSSKSQAVAVVLALEGDLNKVRLSIWFRNGQGEIQEWNQTKLNRLMYLCKLKATDLKTNARSIKDFSGQFITREFIEAFEGKTVGVFLEVTPPKENQSSPNYIIKDFFEPKSHKTTDEIVEKVESKTYDYYIERFANAKPVKRKQATSTDSEAATDAAVDDDSFPF